MSIREPMNSTVLITGAARRIGRAIAQWAADHRWRVILHANRSVEEARDFGHALEREGAEVYVIRGDLAEPEGARAVFEQALAVAETVDAVVNNAAVFSRMPLAEADAASFESVWRINTLAPVILTQCLYRHLRKRRTFGCAVNLLDQRIAEPSIGAMPYLLSKKALEAFTLSGAKELAPTLRINAVAPGAVLLPESVSGREPAGNFPLGVRPAPDDVAAAVGFLLEAETVTGQVLYVDGGQHLT